MKHTLLLLAFIVISLNPFPLQAASFDKSVVILMYHRFGEDQYPTTNVRIEQFKDHLEELQSSEFNILPLPDIIQKLKTGEPLPDKTIGITIDDAFLSVYEEAYPRLKKANFPFTLFVSTGGIGEGSKSYMSWKQINEMVDSGLVTIGNHMVSHSSAIDLSPEEIRREINQAQVTIREKTGTSPSLFSYPYGEYSIDIKNMVKQAGFEAAFGQQSGPVLKEGGFYALPRYALNENFSNADRFRLVVNSLPLPVKDITPKETLLNESINPPPYGFTVQNNVENIQNLKCYASAGGELTMERLGQHRFEIRLEEAFLPGRSRINCTTLAPSGRWRWLGRQFVVK